MTSERASDHLSLAKGSTDSSQTDPLHARASDATGFDAEIDDLIASLTSSGKLDWQDVIFEKESARLENPNGDAFAVPSLASPGTMTLRQLFGGVNSLSSGQHALGCPKPSIPGASYLIFSYQGINPPNL